jgi:hypothetical protein
MKALMKRTLILVAMLMLSVPAILNAAGFSDTIPLSRFDGLVGQYRGIGLGRSPAEIAGGSPAEGWRPIIIYCKIEGYRAPGALFQNSMGYCEIIGRSNWQSDEVVLVPAYPICIYKATGNDYIGSLNYHNGQCQTPNVSNDIQPLVADRDRDGFHTLLLSTTPGLYTNGFIEISWMHRVDSAWNKAVLENVYSDYNPFASD